MVLFRLFPTFDAFSVPVRRRPACGELSSSLPLLFEVIGFVASLVEVIGFAASLVEELTLNSELCKSLVCRSPNTFVSFVLFAVKVILMTYKEQFLPQGTLHRH